MSEQHDRPASEAARQLAAQRRQVERRCPVCGTAFTGTVRKQYCSGRCKIAALRQRRREGDGHGS